LTCCYTFSKGNPRAVEHNFYFHLSFITAAGIYLYKELYLLSLLYFLYLGLAIYGFVNWRESLREEKKAAY
jgi:nicotinamide mononucleotide transporter